jgi:repressor LexA
MIDLTDRQRECLDFIVSFHHAKGYPPTRREIASQNGVSDHLSRLVRKGYIAIDAGKSRGIRVIDQKAPTEPIGMLYLLDAIAEAMRLKGFRRVWTA